MQRCIAVKISLLLSLLAALQLSAQLPNKQVHIEAKFVEVNINNADVFGLRWEITGQTDHPVSSVRLDMKSGWDSSPVPAKLPDGWAMLCDSSKSYTFSGPQVQLPIRLEWLALEHPPESCDLSLANAAVQFQQTDIPIVPMHVPDIPGIRLKKPASKLGLRPFLDWQHLCLTIPDLETSVKTHRKQALDFPEYQVYAESFDHFSRARFGMDAQVRLTDKLDLNLEAGYAYGCRREFRQGWTYTPDPQYNVRDQLDFRFKTLSLGTRLDFRPSSGIGLLDKTVIYGGFNLDFHTMDIDYSHEQASPGWVTSDKGMLSATTTGYSFNLGLQYPILKDMKLGLELGYGMATFKHLDGSLRTETGEDYKGELSMEPIENGDYLTVHRLDEPYPEGYYPAKLKMDGFLTSLRLSYDIPLWYPGQQKDENGDHPGDTPPPQIYGEDISNDEHQWNAYVFIGSISGPASFYESAIINAADEAQSDFEDAGYNVIPNYKATIADFRAVLKDPYARAFWYAGHGTEDDNGPIPMIKDVRGEGISPSQEYYPAEASLLFRKDNLNQVTIHACKQDLPEWREAFPGAEYDSWSISPIGPMMYWWQLGATYPEIDQETGKEIGSDNSGIAPIDRSTNFSRKLD